MPDPTGLNGDDLGGGELEDVAQTLRAVARTDQRDAEHEALREAWRSRSYAGVLQESMWRGDRVALHLQGGPTLRGQLIDTGQDFVTLAPDDPGAVPIDVRIATGLAALEIIERGAARGIRGTGDAFVKFSARLNEYAYLSEVMPTRRVVVAHRASESGWALVRGELRAFAWDHVYLATTGSEVFVPLAMLAYIHWTQRHTTQSGA